MRKKHLLSSLERFHIIRPYIEESVPLSIITEESSLSKSTLKRWIKNYKEQGLAGLERKTRADKGKRRLIIVEIEQLVEALVLNKPFITVAAIHRKVGEIARKKGLQEPTYRVVWDIARGIDPALVKLAHEGSKAYNQEFELVYRREANTPNEIWQADHTPLDIVLIDESGQPRKPWLTTIIDDHSRAICGYYLSFEAPCSINTALALRQAIWKKSNPEWQVCGIPQILYSDNGSDFKSKHIEHVAADLKIQLINSIPGKPQGRGRIERFFQTVNQMLLMDLPGYSPPNKVYPKAILTLKKFLPLFERFIVETYHHNMHSGIGMSPFKRWAGTGFLPQLPESLEQLDLLLLTVARPRKVHRDGIYFQNYVYIEPTLAAYVGEAVIIRYDPRDLAEIRVFHNNSFLCRAICHELSDVKISLKEIIKARQGRKRELREIIKQRSTLMDTILGNPTLDLVASTSNSSDNSDPSRPATKKHKLKLYDND